MVDETKMEASGDLQLNEMLSNATQMGTVGDNHWQGMSIKDLLEEGDLFHLITPGDDDEQKLKGTDESFMTTEIKVIK